MSVNIELLRQMVEWVEEQDALPINQREWEQFDYATTPSDIERAKAQVGNCDPDDPIIRIAQLNPCGTAYCVAGRICADDGYNIVLRGLGFKNAAGESVYPELYAADRLGLTEWQALDLFEGENTAADIRRIAENIAGRAL